MLAFLSDGRDVSLDSRNGLLLHGNSFYHDIIYQPMKVLWINISPSANSAFIKIWQSFWIASRLNMPSKLVLPPPTKLREGNIFTGVCHSVHVGVASLGHSWLGVGVCMVRSMRGWGTCMAGGHTLLGVCMAGGVGKALPHPRPAKAGSMYPTGMLSS